MYLENNTESSLEDVITNMKVSPEDLDNKFLKSVYIYIYIVTTIPFRFEKYNCIYILFVYFITR